MGNEEEAGAVEEGVGGEEDDRVDEDGGPDCCCELLFLLAGSWWSFGYGGETDDPDACLCYYCCACKFAVSTWSVGGMTAIKKVKPYRARG